MVSFYKLRRIAGDMYVDASTGFLSLVGSKRLWVNIGGRRNNSVSWSTICKHQLAARLAASLGACVDVKVSDKQQALLLSKL
ncbi:hypothetical protein RHGRI_013975 [Rhododendron griersonianum]|uniref:Uncharacterized protein n=1 Tax=Rhododendron griersonianum TaxID=479676 RepID=A0AAV6K7X6_9ERIC|nr:hypothetical protein RHGRI_013975 [Rhododendron griersonianum]KAG5548471.1 hypothetical protein RHGRI_013975 [Rhododendron griersonianum]